MVRLERQAGGLLSVDYGFRAAVLVLYTGVVAGVRSARRYLGPTGRARLAFFGRWRGLNHLIVSG